MITTENHLEGTGINALWAMYDGAKRRHESAIALDLDAYTVQIRKQIRDEYAAEINRRGYEAE